MLAESLPTSPPNLSIRLRSCQNALLPSLRTRGFGTTLEPRYIFGAERLDQ